MLANDTKSAFFNKKPLLLLWGNSLLPNHFFGWFSILNPQAKPQLLEAVFYYCYYFYLLTFGSLKKNTLSTEGFFFQFCDIKNLGNFASLF
jgi:hypothetical protein